MNKLWWESRTMQNFFEWALHVIHNRKTLACTQPPHIQIGDAEPNRATQMHADW
jgi:hypothetical protein